MSDKQKNSKKDRHRKSPQNSRYKAEHRQERGKLRRLQAHVKAHGMTDDDVRNAIRKCEIVLFGVPKTDTPVKQRKPRSEGAKAFYRLPDAEKRRRDMREFGVTPKKAA